MGLVVKEIVDIVEDNIQVEIKSGLPGVIGSAIIKSKATDIIDISHYLTKAFGDWFGTQDNPSSQSKILNVLFVDDSAFFRNLLAPILSASGYNVITASSAQEALELREKDIMFDVIISDIEMPEMTGIDFAKAVRINGIWKDLPLIALSSHSKESDIESGKSAGFDEYVAKFDRDKLISVISKLVSSKDQLKMLSN